MVLPFTVYSTSCYACVSRVLCRCFESDQRLHFFLVFFALCFILLAHADILELSKLRPWRINTSTGIVFAEPGRILAFIPLVFTAAPLKYCSLTAWDSPRLGKHTQPTHSHCLLRASSTHCRRRHVAQMAGPPSSAPAISLCIADRTLDTVVSSLRTAKSCVNGIPVVEPVINGVCELATMVSVGSFVIYD
jgi:hypothetical protein